MAMIAYIYPLEESAIGGIFGGDDSLVFMKTDYLLLDKSSDFAEIFNM